MLVALLLPPLGRLRGLPVFQFLLDCLRRTKTGIVVMLVVGAVKVLQLLSRVSAVVVHICISMSSINVHILVDTICAVNRFVDVLGVVFRLVCYINARLI